MDLSHSSINSIVLSQSLEFNSRGHEGKVCTWATVIVCYIMVIEVHCKLFSAHRETGILRFVIGGRAGAPATTRAGFGIVPPAWRVTLI